MTALQRLLRSVLGLGGLLVLWDLPVRFGLVDRAFFPGPADAFVALVGLCGDGDFLRDLVATVLTWLIAVALAAAIAAPCGLLLGSLPLVRTATQSLVEILRPLPPVALIPLVVVVLGSGPDAKILLATYASLWPILFNVIYALDDIDPLLLDTARSFGLGRVRTLASVALPYVAPFAFTGLRLSAAIALIVTISTEYIAGSQIGVGAFVISAYSRVGRMDLVLACTVLIGIIGYLANEGLERLGDRLFRWSQLPGREVPA